jgi:hypothetical protein
MSDFEFGPGGARRFATGTARSITGDGVGTIRYPSPFFDIAHTYLPSSFKTMLRWCRYYFLTNPLINAAVYKMAAYPVTDLVFDTDNEPLRAKWDNFFGNVVQFKKFEVEVGLDFNCYGNCFISIFYPFQKYLICKTCKHQERVDKQKYKFQEFKFYGTCRACHNYAEFDVKDHYIKSAKDIRLVRWNPEQISIHHNDATGETLYYYTIPSILMNDIRMAKRHVIEKTPQVFIDALRLNKSLLFNKDNIYHMKRPTIAQKDKGWGLPMILPVLKDTFYLQILRKAQEAIAIEHIVPLRILFPQTAGPTSDVYSTVNLSTWKQKIESEILRWRLDNNYIPILPLPVGQQTLGAEGKALMLAQEYRVWAEHIIAGMGVPVEFVFGGMQFSGSNVSLRILENQFLDYKSDHQALVQDFIMPNVGAFMGWQAVKTHFRRFKMADDLQRSAYHFQLNQAGKLSDKSLLEETDWDANIEQERIAEEQKRVLEGQRRQAIAQAAIQGEAQLVMQKYQLRAQKAMESSMPTPAGVPGQASPGAQGQQQLQEQQQALSTGQFEDAQGGAQESAGLPAELQSPLSTDQVIGGDPSALPGPGLQSIADRVSRMLDQMPEAERQPHLVQLRRHNPQLYSIVQQDLQVRRGAHVSSAAMPRPSMKPARRGPEAAAAA